MASSASGVRPADATQLIEGCAQTFQGWRLVRKVTPPENRQKPWGRSTRPEAADRPAPHGSRSARTTGPGAGDSGTIGVSAHLHPKPANARLLAARWTEFQAAAEMMEGTRRDVAVSAAILRADAVTREEPDPG